MPSFSIDWLLIACADVLSSDSWGNSWGEDEMCNLSCSEEGRPRLSLPKERAEWSDRLLQVSLMTVLTAPHVQQWWVREVRSYCTGPTDWNQYLHSAPCKPYGLARDYRIPQPFFSSLNARSTAFWAAPQSFECKDRRRTLEMVLRTRYEIDAAGIHTYLSLCTYYNCILYRNSQTRILLCGCT